MKKALLFFFLINLGWVNAQQITFDDQGYTNAQNLGNPYNIINNGETFRFIVSNGGAPNATNHIYKTVENGGCGSSAVSHISSGNFSATTWTIETVSGNEIDLGTIRFDNVYECFSFSYDLSIEGFKNGMSTGAEQTFYSA